MRINAANDVDFGVRTRLTDRRIALRMGWVWYTLTDDEATELASLLNAAADDVQKAGGND